MTLLLIRRLADQPIRHRAHRRCWHGTTVGHGIPLDTAPVCATLFNNSFDYLSDVTLLDVRPALEYLQVHIPDARSIPVEELEQRLDELPRDREVVAYCRGPYCVFSDEAAELLQTHGFRVRRFEEGFPEWRAAGLPVATT